MSNVRRRMQLPPRYFVFALVALASLATIGQETSQPTPAAQQPQQQIASTNADPAWRPSDAQRDSIEIVTKAYFAVRDANKAEAAYAFLSERQKQYVPFPPFSRMLEEFNTKAGQVQSRTLRKVTWYKDTPHAGPGLYVAVDFSSRFTGLALHCGYVVWHEQSDGSFLQVREEVNLIDNATMAKLKPGQLESVRSQFRC
jgi:Protein of unknown function (DUF4019)